MKHALLLVLFVVSTVVSVAEDLEKYELPATVVPADQFSNTPPPKTTTTTPKTTTTTPKTTTTTPKTTTTTPKTTTTTPKTTTTTPQTTTTTPKTTTTTPKTTTTTPKTTTTTPKTTTTTPKTTTTTPKTTTTAKPPKPTPPAALAVGKYSTKNKNNITCLLAEMALQIRLVSAKNSTGNRVYLDDLNLSLFYPFITPAEKYTQENKSLHLFAARIGHAYYCRNDSIFMGNGLYLDVTQNQMQAFNFTKNNMFDVSDPCPADAPNYSVAIVVGVILLVLIIIVVVAYILGRRRRSGGYQPL
ncbi:hypothetical protein CRUP_029752 [Coryphaenoides rupestris]|nr:hypothetical protein CRUP_029752 [Coryphaenoides rupestris]